MNKPTKKDIYKQIAELITESRKQVRTAVNTTMVITYWNIGKIIVEDELKGEKRAEYGKATIKHLSVKLTAEFGEGYDASNLRYMKLFYMKFPIRDAVSLESPKTITASSKSLICDAVSHKSPIPDSISTQLSWTHYRHLLKVENEKARQWYMKEAISENWTTRALERQINSFYYERLLSSQNKKPLIEEAKRNTKDLEPDDIFKDLVFYNYKLKCFVLIDLKRGKLTHQDVGQMDSYVRIYEEKFRAEDDNPTIGLILCSEKNETIAKYSVLADGKKLFASKYRLYLPTEEQLEKLMVKEEMALYGAK
ncbi:MAG: DUF1016 family protein [Candidatus Delongbacteria bacterium]|nr:DUF1016 family protein [Candidatus Delongbacteria bacterium]MCG2761499.1 PDDEXK nuclease domain-containing protein [Candidatus Delongbacteria bacterium]